MSIRDRGNRKWTAMMLTEHTDRLAKWVQETREVSKPQLDEQKLEEMNYLLCLSLVEKLPLVITYYHSKGFLSHRGIIQNYSPLDKEVLFRKEEGGLLNLVLADIVDIDLL